MSDFQKFLNETFQKIDIYSIGESQKEVNEYDIYKEISMYVMNVRSEAGFTQKELAHKSGLTQSNISKIEKGEIHPTIDSLKKIADAVGKRLVVEFKNREMI